MRAPIPAMAVVMAAARATAMLVMPTGLSLSRDEPGGQAGSNKRTPERESCCIHREVLSFNRRLRTA
jgi:hypothetical protein